MNENEEYIEKLEGLKIYIEGKAHDERWATDLKKETLDTIDYAIFSIKKLEKIRRWARLQKEKLKWKSL